MQEDKEKELKAKQEETLIQKEMIRLRKELEEERQRSNKEKLRFVLSFNFFRNRRQMPNIINTYMIPMCDKYFSKL